VPVASGPVDVDPAAGAPAHACTGSWPITGRPQPPRRCASTSRRKSLRALATNRALPWGANRPRGQAAARDGGRPPVRARASMASLSPARAGNPNTHEPAQPVDHRVHLTSGAAGRAEHQHDTGPGPDRRRAGWTPTAASRSGDSHRAGPGSRPDASGIQPGHQRKYRPAPRPRLGVPPYRVGCPVRPRSRRGRIRTRPAGSAEQAERRSRRSRRRSGRRRVHAWWRALRAVAAAGPVYWRARPKRLEPLPQRNPSKQRRLEPGPLADRGPQGMSGHRIVQGNYGDPGAQRYSRQDRTIEPALQS
jgi:hypothetical protein